MSQLVMIFVAFWTNITVGAPMLTEKKKKQLGHFCRPMIVFPVAGCLLCVLLTPASQKGENEKKNPREK